MRVRPLILGVVALLVLLIGCGSGGTTVGADEGVNAPGTCNEQFDGGIQIDQPVRLANGPAACDFLINGLIQVNAALLIEPGTRVQFGPGGGISVKGESLLAEGTAQAPIVLEGSRDVPGSWIGIEVLSASDRVSLDHVLIRNAGQTGTLITADAGLKVANARVSFTNSEIARSAQRGAVFERTAEIVAFSSNRFSANQQVPLVVQSSQVPQLDPATSFDFDGSPSDVRAIVVDDARLNDQAERVWPAVAAPYRLSALTVSSGAIVISAGVQIEFSPAGVLSTRDSGRLDLVGTADNPIRVTGVDSSPGGYSGFRFFGSIAAKLENVQIEGGGGRQAGGSGTIGVGSTSSLSLENVSVQGGAGWAVSCNQGAQLTLRGSNTFSDNPLGEVQPTCSVQ
ncbi:MAG: hypothetical protein AB8C46_07835 [Burkholderiaceae bacterium]